MRQKDIQVRHRRFLETEAMTVKFRGLAPEMIQHMSRTDSETLSDWIKDAVRFRLRYDLKGICHYQSSYRSSLQSHLKQLKPMQMRLLLEPLRI